ncbi:DUF1688-domain-containing protein [Exidia glandulosa HHB12029]|uniref:DUF1688-domain-containing protein n=1 Tax=Exidia glandulosa HHB12029 TaxID=1314781 RepID=A0A165N3L0_EXIGL|nr:DUF1688-domain-containing protein [Exidia glandulosa HHB12029]
MNLAATQSPETTAAYLRTLPAIRERCARVFKLGQEDKLQHFTYHAEHEPAVVQFCIEIIQRDFGTNYASIPPHGRWRHFDVDKPRLQPIVDSWRSSGTDDIEIARRLVELSLVSVLLDAGAGPVWSFHESSTGKRYGRSEGLAVASLEMYESGFFSGGNEKWRVDAEGLSRASETNVGRAMQVDSDNRMDGLTGRAALLSNLGLALQDGKEFFGAEARAGNLVDFLATQLKDGHVHIFALWSALMDGLVRVWPATRTKFGGVSLGDVWPCPALVSNGADRSKGDDLVPFHKLTQWLAYSLVEPLERILGWKVDGLEDMTGLPEYRNGGLFVDFGVLKLRNPPDDPNEIPQYEPSHPAIVEWRALTVILLDRTAAAIRKELNVPDLSTAQILESATWKGGREIAKRKRGASGGGPPIGIVSDGTVF